MSRNGPPPIEEFLGLDRKVPDALYDQSSEMPAESIIRRLQETGVGSMSGVRGCWHRLWAVLVLKHSMPKANSGSV